MQLKKEMKSNIQSAVMRRVYYSYAISIGTHVMFWQGIFLSVAAILLAEWLHVASIINNFLSVPVGTAPQFIVNSFWSALYQGEVLMVGTFVLAAFVTVSCGYKVAHALTSQMWTLSRV